MVFKKKFIFYAIILGLALFSRTYRLDSVPVGFHEDEAHIGYNSYSLLKTGNDKNGQFLPLSIDQFGDFRPAGYHYFAVPSIGIFGLNEFATRFPAALFGSLSVIVLFFISRSLFKSEAIGFVSALVLAVSPWHIIASRATSESILALFFVLLGIFFFIKYIKEKPNVKLLIFSGFLLITSYFFYHSARFFVPMFIFSLTFIFFFLIEFSRKQKIHLILFNIFLVLFLVCLLFLSHGGNRPAAISIFSTAETQLVLNEQIREDGFQNTLITRAIHNKLINYSYTFTENYFQHFSGEFLFMRGGLPARYTVPWTGMFFPVSAPFLIIGIAFLFVEALKEKKISAWIILTWIIVGPIPSALTWEDLPNIQRSIMMLPPLVIAISYGLVKLLELFKQQRLRRAFILIVCLLFTFNSLLFFHNYFTHTSTHRPWQRSVNEKELVAMVNSFSNKRKVIMTKANTNDIIFYLFYLKIDPKDYQLHPATKINKNVAYKNLLFVDTDCPTAEEPLYKKAIYINRGECPTPDFMVELGSVSRTDGTLAFKALEYRGKQ